MKKIFLLLILVICAAGGVFAQSDFKTMPKNNVSVDIAPLIAGVGMGLMYKTEGTNISESNTYGFGFAVQYERQLNEKMSVGGRFSYLCWGEEVKYEGGWNGRREDTKNDRSSFSIEGHFRIYPAAKVFFLDSMFGCANYSGTHNEGYKTLEGSRFFLKIGEKVGWRIDFGKPGGFYFEPSVGLYYALGFGPNLEEQLTDSNTDSGEVDNLLEDMYESLIIVGGPRIGLSVGWRF
jgi:hypothetical protein